jgi:anti-sigma regulatory factor (Ser/Thr protein kinase)
LSGAPEETRTKMQASTRLRGRLPSISEGRRFVASKVSEWGCPAELDVATLLTSELLTNAVIHAHSDIGLHLHCDGERVRVEVSDESDTEPVLLCRDIEALNGRGLHLVDEMATDWGVRPAAVGKTVWFELPAGG